MTYYLNLFSPETAKAFAEYGGTVSGFSASQRSAATKVKRGDRFICYVTRISRWIGVLEVEDGPFEDDTPLFRTTHDPFVIRFRVRQLAWFDFSHAIPIHEDSVWKQLSFTKDHLKTTSSWTGKIRSSLTALTDSDGSFLECVLIAQHKDETVYPLSDADHRKIKKHVVKTHANQEVEVTVPEDESRTDTTTQDDNTIRQSFIVQARLSEIGSAMGYRIWIPASDKSRVLSALSSPLDDEPLNQLPLNYDTTTLSTIENIDVIWIRGRSIIRVFEVEHTTSIYSGILRMADLIALQPNIDIKAHIVAPIERQEKVFEELKRPVFSLLEKGPLATYCSYISYDAVDALLKERFISHMTDSVLEEIAEYAE